ncbi:MAG TPA: hypothetical protein VMG82_13105 [Candidatus Sulfotelmatobacter sp.]|nr:hypothetical protein [Candidatus Sulfotelmatobacter sp.]
MEEIDHKHTNSGELDPLIDAALAKYASVEPREGMEERILANLSCAKTSIGIRTWRNWRVAALIAAVLIVASSLLWQEKKAPHPPIVVHRPTPGEAPRAAYAANRNAGPPPQTKLPQRRTNRLRAQREIVAPVPKLAVFPSPLPLSEQEQILASYIAQYPEHAALVAEARMDAIRHEDEERRRIANERNPLQ